MKNHHRQLGDGVTSSEDESTKKHLNSDKGSAQWSQKRKRINYSRQQLEEFERIFYITKYPDRNKLLELSARMKVPETRLRTWFQNKRARIKRMNEKMGLVGDSERFDVLSSVKAISQISSCPIAVPQPSLCSPPLKNSPEALSTETRPRSAGCTGNNSTYPTFTYQPSMSTSVASSSVRMAYPQPIYAPYINPMFSSLNLLASPTLYEQGQNLQPLIYSSPPSSASRLMDPQIATYLNDYYGNLTRQYSCSTPQLNPSPMYCTPPYSPPYRRDYTPTDFTGRIVPSCDYASQFCKSFERGLGNTLSSYSMKNSLTTDNSISAANSSHTTYQPIYQPVSPCSPGTCDTASRQKSYCDYKNSNVSTAACTSNVNASYKSFLFKKDGDTLSKSCDCCSDTSRGSFWDQNMSDLNIDKDRDPVAASLVPADSTTQQSS